MGAGSYVYTRADRPGESGKRTAEEWLQPAEAKGILDVIGGAGEDAKGDAASSRVR